MAWLSGLPVRGLTPLLAEAAQGAHEGVEEQGRGHGLEQHGLEAAVIGPAQDFLAAKGRDHDQMGRLGVVGADAFGGFQAVHAGHLPVEQHDLEGLALALGRFQGV